jgi:proton glutamate symport protein
MSLTTKVLLALVGGLAVGLAINGAGVPGLTSVAGIAGPIGTLWINAIRMTVIPLVVGSLIVGVASAPNPGALGRLGIFALAFFVGTLLVGGIITALVAPPLLSAIPIDPAATAALRGQAGAAPALPTPPSFAQWLLDLVPANPVRAAADGAMLPLIVFSLTLGLAVATLSAEPRQRIIRFFEAVRDAALTLVRWVLIAAPAGVFALALALAARLGLTAAGALLGYVVAVAIMTVVFALVVLYPLASALGRMPLGTFARGALPAQAVAFSSRSSLASLPAMIDSARTRLRLPEEISSFFLPLAASMYRVGASVGQTTGVVFIAHLYGVTLSPVQLASVVLTVVLTSFSVPGIPGGSIVIMAPALASAGLPAEGLGILLGVDTIPDMFRTTANVTGQLAAGVALRRTVRGRSETGEASELSPLPSPSSRLQSEA